MLYFELLPPVVAAIVLASAKPGTVWCSALDNAGAAFVLNKLSCSCPLALELLRRLADCLAANRAGLIAGHAHRHKNEHCDALSHLMTPSIWSQVLRSATHSRKGRDEVHFVVYDIARKEAWAATVAFARPSPPSAPRV